MGKRLTNQAFKEPLIELIDEEDDIDYSGLRIDPETQVNPSDR